MGQGGVAPPPDDNAIMLELLGIMVIILLTMVGYASGATLAANRRAYEPGIVDLGAIFGLWVLFFWLRPQLARPWLLAAVIGGGIMCGYLVGVARLARQDTAREVPASELPAHAREKGETVVAANLFRRGWQRWNDFAARMGNIQGRLLMGFFYFLVVTPFGLVARLFTDPLAIKQTPPQTNWQPKEETDATLEAAREQG